MNEDLVEVIFEPFGKRGYFRKGTTILDAARNLGVEITSICGGLGVCGKCKVRVIAQPGDTSPLTSTEEKLLTKEEIENGYRLACLTKVFSNIKVYVPERSRITHQRLQVEGLEVAVKTNPMVKKVYLELSPPKLESVSADDLMLKDALRFLGFSEVEIDYEVIKDLPELLRQSKWRISVVLWNGSIISVEQGNTTKRCFGFACDIGSTKLAGYLVDLNTGETVAVTSRINPQIQYGDDIISRISYVIEKGFEGLRDLQRSVVSAINEMIDEVCSELSISSEEIYELSFAGNTAMQLFLLAIYPKYLAYSPYQPPRKSALTVRSQDLGIKANKCARCFIMPVIGGFVGGDQVAVIISSGIHKSEEIMMEMDIGTNTEITLGNKEELMSVSCASGPAFEGMHIKYGMRASDGAIESISIDPSTFNVKFRVIGNVAPVGLCGSALIDALAEMLKAGIIDWSGAFNKEQSKFTKRLRKRNSQWEFVIVWKNESGINDDIVITQSDIREIQKAKAAIRTGAEILMRRMNIKEKDISSLLIAGAFGNYINPESARTIGMYPELPIEKYKFIGNAAGTGAKLALISKDMRREAEEVSKKVKYLELAAEPDFQKVYLDSLYLPFRDLSRYPMTVEYLRKFNFTTSK